MKTNKMSREFRAIYEGERKIEENEEKKFRRLSHAKKPSVVLLQKLREKPNTDYNLFLTEFHGF